VLKLTLKRKEAAKDGITMIKSFVDLKVLHSTLFIAGYALELWLRGLGLLFF